MRGLVRLLTILLIVVFGFLLYVLVASWRSRTPYVASEVSADSISVYQNRADSLELIADSLRSRLDQAGLLQQPRIQLQLDRLDEEIRSLRVAITKWETAHKTAGAGAAYRECILLYGRASGACQVLRAVDPVPPPGEGGRP